MKGVVLTAHHSFEKVGLDSKTDIRLRSLVNDIRSKLKLWNIRYRSGKPLVSDKKYDLLYNKFLILAKYYRIPDIEIDDDPNYSISLEKIAHSTVVQSINSVSDLNQVWKWVLRKKLKSVVLQPKVDGINLTLIIEKNQIKHALSRGNKIYGYDHLPQIKQLRNIRFKGDGYIKCEAYISKDDWKIFSNEYSSPRNMVASILNRREFSLKKSHLIKFIRFDNDIEKIESDLEQVPEKSLSITDNDTFFSEIDQYKNYVSTLPYQIDGIIIKSYTINTGQKKLRDDCIAWKFYEPQEKTKIVDCNWFVGKNGIITPVLSVAPVKIENIIIKNVTLHNISLFEKLNPGKDDVITIKLGGFIIPTIVQIEHMNRVTFNLPEYCLSCKSKLEKIEKNLMCLNTNCKEKFFNYLKYSFNKNNLNIRSINIEKIVNAFNKQYTNPFGFILSVLTGKIYLILFKAYKSKSLSNAINAFNNLYLDLYKILLILNISGISNAWAKKISEIFASYTDLIDFLEERNNLDLKITLLKKIELLKTKEVILILKAARYYLRSR